MMMTCSRFPVKVNANTVSSDHVKSAIEMAAEEAAGGFLL